MQTTSLLYVPEFQFHKGTIRTQYGEESAASVDYFNSIKVRLELHLLAFFFPTPAFQFHKGTIRTILSAFDKWYYIISIP